MEQPGETARDNGPASSADGADAGPVVCGRWPRKLWDRADEAAHHQLARLCPLCPDPHALQVAVEGLGSFNMPAAFNACGFTITVPQGTCESTVVWDPCGHTIVVEDRLIPPLEGGNEPMDHERDLLLSTFNPSDFSRPPNHVFTEPAEDFSVRDELVAPCDEEEAPADG
jgi:hypothetical protein